MIGTCARCRGALRLISPGCLPSHGGCFECLPPLELDPHGLYELIQTSIAERSNLIEQKSYAMRGDPISLIAPIEEEKPNGKTIHHILHSDHPKYKEQQAILLDNLQTKIEIIDYRLHTLMREILEWHPKQMPGESDEVFKARA